MRAQIRKDPSRDEMWWVYTKAGWQLRWGCRTYVVGEDATQRALGHPETVAALDGETVEDALVEMAVARITEGGAT